MASRVLLWHSCFWALCGKPCWHNALGYCPRNRQLPSLSCCHLLEQGRPLVRQLPLFQVIFFMVKYTPAPARSGGQPKVRVCMQAASRLISAGEGSVRAWSWGASELDQHSPEHPWLFLPPLPTPTAGQTDSGRGPCLMLLAGWLLTCQFCEWSHTHVCVPAAAREDWPLSERVSFDHPFYFIFIFIAAPVACGNSQVRGWIWVAAATHIAAVATPAPEPTRPQQ